MLIGKLFVELGVISTGFGKSLQSASEAVEKVGRKMKEMGEQFGRVGLMVAGVGALMLRSASEGSAAIQHQFDRLKGSWAKLSADVGQLMLPALTEVADYASRIVNAWKNLDPELQRSIVKFAEIATAGLLIVGALGKVAGWVAALMPVFSALGAVVGAGLLGPILAVSAAIAALVLLAGVLYDVYSKNSDEIGKALTGAFDWAADTAKNYFQFMVDNVKGLANFWLGMANKIFNAMEAIYNVTPAGMALNAAGVKNPVIEAQRSVLAGLDDVINGDGTAKLGTYIAKLGTTVVGKGVDIIAALGDMAATTGDSALSGLKKLWEKLMPSAPKIPGAGDDSLPKVPKVMSAERAERQQEYAARGVAAAVMPAPVMLSAGSKAIEEGITEAQKQWGETFGRMGKVAEDVGVGVVPLGPVFDDLWAKANDASVLGGEAFDAAVSALEEWKKSADDLNAMHKRNARTLGEVFSNMEEEASKSAKFYGANLTDAMMLATSIIGNAMTAAAPKFASVVSDAMKGMEAGGVWGAIIAAIVSLLSKTEAFGQIMGLFEEGIGSIIKAINPILVPLIQVSEVANKILGLIMEVVGPLLELIGTAFSYLSASIEPVLSVVISVLTPIFKAIGNSFKMLGNLFENLMPVLTPLLAIVKPIFAVLGFLLNAIGEVSNFITNMLGPVFSAFGVAVQWISNAIIDIVLWIVGAIRDIWNWIVGALDTVLGWTGIDFKALSMTTGALDESLKGMKSTVDAVSADGKTATRRGEEYANEPQAAAVDQLGASASAAATALNEFTASVTNAPTGFDAGKYGGGQSFGNNAGRSPVLTQAEEDADRAMRYGAGYA